ncbi:hypothetical protein BC829DRAFT_381048 [Chytridium lagenaria]|nr:hypothetical protein BC829DRAFT_381048 [Chytridium lagenaria]
MASTPEVISQECVVTASSTDNSAECAARKCSPQQAVVDGNSGDDEGDLTWWQSLPDKSCNPEWMNLNWSDEGSRKILDFRVIYGPLGDRLKADYFPDITYNTSSQASIPLLYGSGKPHFREDKCQVRSNLFDVTGMRLTWKLQPVNGSCQINVNEVVVHAAPNPPSENKGGLSGGIIAAIVVPIVVIAGAVGALFAIRHRNLQRRKLTGRV